MKDDRIFKTSFHGETELAGVHNADEFHILGDWAAENGFPVAAALLHEVGKHVHFKEPKRKCGWAASRRGNSAHHFFTLENPSQHDAALCGRSLSWPDQDLVWCQYWGRCPRCENLLRTQFQKKYAPAIAALDRIIAEVEAEN